MARVLNSSHQLLGGSFAGILGSRTRALRQQILQAAITTAWPLKQGVLMAAEPLM